MSHLIAALSDIFPLVDGHGGVVFRVIDAETVVSGDDSDELLALYRTHPPVPGSSHIHDDEHVSPKLGAGWSYVASIPERGGTSATYRDQKVLSAARAAQEAPGVYAVEMFLDGDEYAQLVTYLLRWDA